MKNEANKTQRLRKLENAEILSILDNTNFSVMYENENAIDWFYADNSHLQELNLVGFMQKQTNKMSGDFWINAIIWSKHKNVRLRFGDNANINSKEFYMSLDRYLSICISKDVEYYSNPNYPICNFSQ